MLAVWPKDKMVRTLQDIGAIKKTAILTQLNSLKNLFLIFIMIPISKLFNFILWIRTWD